MGGSPPKEPGTKPWGLGTPEPHRRTQPATPQETVPLAVPQSIQSRRTGRAPRAAHRLRRSPSPNPEAHAHPPPCPHLSPPWSSPHSQQYGPAGLLGPNPTLGHLCRGPSPGAWRPPTRDWGHPSPTVGLSLHPAGNCTILWQNRAFRARELGHPLGAPSGEPRPWCPPGETQGSHSPSPVPSSRPAWELYEHWEGHTCCLLGPNLTLGLLRRVPSLFACLQGTRIWAHLCTTRVLSLPHSRKLSIWGCSKDSEQENQRAPSARPRESPLSKISRI